MSSIQIEQNGHVRTIPLPAGETLLSVLRRAGYSIPAACGGKGRCGKCRVPVNGVPRLACRVYPADGDTVTLPETAGGTILTGTVPLPACRPGRTGCAAAVDLGTTTVVARLYDLAAGTELQTCSGWNAQAPYGADVISRIQYTLEKPDGLPELSRRIREQIWALVSDALARSGRTPGTLREITLAGNTVMQHLFAGYSVRGIAAAPFRPETLFAAPGDETLHGVPVHFAPCVAGYVGGDITAGLLAAGIEQRLFDPERGFYRSGYSLDRRGFMPEENWIILYCRRWYEGRPEAWERAYAELLSDTAIRWDDHTLVTGETPGRRFMLLGKFFAQQLGYFAGTGREAELRDGLCFLEESVRRPFNLYPEWWFHHRPEKLSGYIRDFLADHRELWCAYAEDPAGDYTVDSGNCEQTAVFLQHMLDDILGVRFRHGRLQLRPALVHGGGCSALPVECGKALSFHYENNRLEVETGLCREFELGLPAAAGLPYIVTVNGIPAEARRESGQQLDTLFVTCPPAAGRIQITVHPEGDRV